MTFLRAVLFAKGTGADASSYQPNRDESQWWNRRDALVRCVAAFLFMPGQRELVLLFEEDWSRMHMTYKSSVNEQLVPKEQTIVGLWKKAAQQGKLVQENGLSCQLYKSKANSRVPSKFDSKRDVLEYLQATCSIEFLREKGLNSSSKVLLRKMNKQASMEIGKEWNQRYGGNKTDSSQETLVSILECLLQPISSEIQTVVAATLHESSHHELPCWNLSHQDSSNGPQHRTQVCVFLGAVRDMTTEEVRCLQQTCQTCKIPQVAVRLGPVPEFTSKILSVVAYHHAHHKLWPALRALLNPNSKRPREAISQSIVQSTSHLHFVSIVPFPSTKVTTDLQCRDRSLWCLVRCIVVSLWRSRLAGTHDDERMVNNTLTLWFTDGQYLTLQQNELVTLLAEKHQAAPTEFQILQALQDQLLAKSSEPSEDSATSILNSILAGSVPRVLLDLDLAASSSLCLTDLLYQYEPGDETNGTISGGNALILLSMQTTNDVQYCLQAKKLFREASQARDIPILPCSFRETNFQDFEASTITMLQHFCYQGLLFPFIQQQLNLYSSKQDKKSKKRKHKKKHA